MLDNPYASSFGIKEVSMLRMRLTGCWRLMVLCGAVMMVLSGCGHDGAGSSDMMSWDQANAEYRTTVERFPFDLPDGDDFPERIQSASNPDQLYQKGWGEGQAYFYWMCAVERRTIDTVRSSPDMSRQWAETLGQVLDTSWFRTYYQDTDGTFANDVVSKAELGDVSVMSQFYDSDCAWYRQVNGL